MIISRRPGGRGLASVRPLVGSLLAALLAAPLAGGARAAAAQGPTVTNPPRTQEFGLDAGAVIGLGGQSSISIDVPTARARVGFFMSNASRWSLEPAAGLSFVKVEDTDARLFYNLEAGALYHTAPPGDVQSATRASVAYVRPFVGLNGVTGEGGDSEVSLGIGIGAKAPWRAGLAWRFEGNVGYGFDNEAFRIGAFVGLSIFTRRGG
jgi:hypothetical protein